MPKVFLKKTQEKKRDKDYNLDKIKDILSENNACYVLITCSESSQEGNMKVELNYEGDDCLASYLIDGAQRVFFDGYQAKQLG